MKARCVGVLRRGKLILVRTPTTMYELKSHADVRAGNLRGEVFAKELTRCTRARSTRTSRRPFDLIKGCVFEGRCTMTAEPQPI